MPENRYLSITPTREFQIFHYSQREWIPFVLEGCSNKKKAFENWMERDVKILLFESLEGTVAKMETYLCQLKQIGAFDKLAGIILGTFTEMETEKCIPAIETLVKRIVEKDLPIVVTRDIGHGTDSKGIIIGQDIYLKE